MPALRPTTCTLFSVLALLLAVLLSGEGAKAQGLTTYTDFNGATVTTSLTPTVYTTDGATLTFTATTPTTPVPSVTSSGSVMNIRDYMAAQSAAGNGGAQKAHFIAPQTDLKSHAAPSFGRPRAPPPRWAALAVVVPVSAVLAGSIKWVL